MFRHFHRAVRWGFGLWLVLLAGCATMPDNGDSDLPWTEPQSWEGVAPLPGFVNR